MSEQKVAIVTGAARGIGCATARRLHQDGFSLVLSGRSRDELESLGVDVRTGVQVTAVTPEAIETRSGETVVADLRVWAAGVRGSAWLRNLDGLEVTANAQLVALPTLQSTRDEHIFVMGDCCSCTLPGSARPVPPRAQAAHQMATTVARNIEQLMRGRALVQYAYRDYGSLVSLSRYSTVGSLMGSLIGGRMAVEGRLARFVYMSLYRMHLLAIHGWLKGWALILVGHVSRILRPKLKLH